MNNAEKNAVEIRCVTEEMRRGHSFEIVCACGRKTEIVFVPKHLIDKTEKLAKEILETESR